jgi:hypothetical protein
MFKIYLYNVGLADSNLTLDQCETDTSSVRLVVGMPKSLTIGGASEPISRHETPDRLEIQLNQRLE